MRYSTPTPPELGTQDGLSYALFLPDSEPDVGVVILHGAGSAKESHFDFARGCRADGMAALAYDTRGHGHSEGSFGPSAFDDALAMVELLQSHAPRVALRGSSMGGFQAIHAAAQAGERTEGQGSDPGVPGVGTGSDPGVPGVGTGSDPCGAEGRADGRAAGGGPEVCAVVAICPAPEDGLLRFLRSGQRPQFACDADACEPWLASLDIYEAAGRLGPETALLLMHARGDERIPYTVSERIHESAREPKRLLLLPGGHHRSIQHDEELQAVSRKFVRDAAASINPRRAEHQNSPGEF